MNEEKKHPALRNLLLITEVGLSVIIPTLLMLFLGKWITEKSGQKIWIVLFLLLGLVAGGFAAWRLLKRFAPKKEDDRKKEEYDLMAEWHRKEDDELSEEQIL